ncbi:hypothetical protein Glove_543g74 [Diversispora epigaea]|uniref:Phosphatidylinositol-specific phospholipase C X domain-containing protein n=1 Tax=Diversispora epigaea TaxID=1348612 RepID=A0A397GL59_9GLOM|nr:hypothetical protein Glove_543g74 [Diversispora epigaea]
MKRFKTFKTFDIINIINIISIINLLVIINISVDAAAAAVDYNNYNNIIECNGDSDICDLYFYQVTFAGTHNSAAYNLKYDCNILAESCFLKANSNSCNQQYETCKQNRTTSCDIQTNLFKNWNPNYLHWTSDLFNSICKTSDVLCAAWYTICQKARNSCELLRDVCENEVPDQVLKCLWENNDGYPIKRQLEDGIRFLDLDTCQVGNESVVFCHGMGLSRALGADLDSIFLDIKEFMEDNPNEILNLGFGDYDGLDAPFVANFIQNKLEYHFVNGSGYSLMLQAKGGDDGSFEWPTLREMIEINQRIIIWFGPLYGWLGPLNNTRKDWVHNIESHYVSSYTYTAGDLTAQQLNDSFTKWSDNSQNIIADDLKNFGHIRWQTIDNTVGLELPGLEKSLKHKQSPGMLCLKDLANKINYNLLDYFFDIFKDKFPYIFKVSLDFYPQSNLFEVVKKLNQLNVQKFKIN